MHLSAVRAAEAEARIAADIFEAQVKARRAQARRGAEDAATRIARLKQQIADVLRDTEGVAAQLEADDGVTARRNALEAAQALSSRSRSGCRRCRGGDTSGTGSARCSASEAARDRDCAKIAA